MEIRRIYVSSNEKLIIPEDSVFFPPMIEAGAILVHVLLGSSNKTKVYYVKTITEHVVFGQDYISLQALGWVDNYGSIQFIYVLEVEDA